MSDLTIAARRLALFAFCTLLVACGKSDAPGAGSADAGSTPAAASEAEQDLADISQYRLTMDKFDKYIAAQKNLAVKSASMTPAQRAALEARNDVADPNQNLDETVKRIESEPMVVAAIRDAGLSPREFMMITMSFLQTGMAAAVAKMQPNANQDSLIRAMKANPDNVKFYNENEAEITRKAKALEDEMKRLGIEG
jgi:hypothetical protein